VSYRLQFLTSIVSTIRKQSWLGSWNCDNPTIISEQRGKSEFPESHADQGRTGNWRTPYTHYTLDMLASCGRLWRCLISLERISCP
jgi:hypothetical protein